MGICIVSQPQERRDLPRWRRASYFYDARRYAERGWRVFPLHSVDEDGRCTCGKLGCRIIPGERTDAGKHPRINGWPDAATTDVRQIAWWQYHWPDSNLAIATGRKSNLFVLDVDVDKEGVENLEALEDECGDLPSTYIVQTGRGGIQFYFQYPEDREIKTGSNILGEGIDVRGEGGYVAAPPGVTQDEYRLMSPVEGDVAYPPDWLLERLTKPSKGLSEKSTRHSKPVSVALDGPPILDGERNDKLASIAGKLHDGTRNLEQLSEELLAINERRCKPPLPEREVTQIAVSIYHYPPSRKSTPEVSTEVLAALDAIESDMWEHPERRRGKAGDTWFKMKMALIDRARRFGTMIPTGVRVEISYRQLAEEAGCHRDTISNNVPKMKKAGELRADNLDRRADEAGAFVLPIHESAQTSDTCLTRERAVYAGLDVGTARALRRLRHAARGYQRLGPRAGRVALVLARLGGSATLEEIADALSMKRPRDLLRRDGVLDRMKRYGLIEVSDKRVKLTSDWPTALDRAKGSGSEFTADLRQWQRHAAERATYAERLSKNHEEQSNIETKV